MAKLTKDADKPHFVYVKQQIIPKAVAKKKQSQKRNQKPKAAKEQKAQKEQVLEKAQQGVEKQVEIIGSDVSQEQAKQSERKAVTDKRTEKDLPAKSQNVAEKGGDDGENVEVAKPPNNAEVCKGETKQNPKNQADSPNPQQDTLEKDHKTLKRKRCESFSSTSTSNSAKNCILSKHKEKYWLAPK
jgi:hypothetical protein